MSSNEVMQEMAAFKVDAKNVEDARARAIGMHKGTSLALKAKVVEQEDDEEAIAMAATSFLVSSSSSSPDEYSS